MTVNPLPYPLRNGNALFSRTARAQGNRLAVTELPLRFNEYEILKDAGKVSHAIAKSLAEKEFDKFRALQDRSFESDFERESARLMAKSSNANLDTPSNGRKR